MIFYISILWQLKLRSLTATPYNPQPKPLKSANSHRDGALESHDPCNCRRFRRLKAAILVIVVTFGSLCFRRASKVPTVTGMGPLVSRFLYLPSPLDLRSSDKLVSKIMRRIKVTALKVI